MRAAWRTLRPFVPEQPSTVLTTPPVGSPVPPVRGRCDTRAEVFLTRAVADRGRSRSVCLSGPPDLDIVCDRHGRFCEYQGLDAAQVAFELGLRDASRRVGREEH